MTEPLAGADTMLAQIDQMAADHFFTDDFKEDHPNKIQDAFYKRGEQEDVWNVQLEMNEIDNYNPRAQARLARYAEYM
jgi:hypothetical protein